MGFRQRLQRLEARFPKPHEPRWPDFEVDPDGLNHADALRQWAQRLRDNANDKRATKEERREWLELAVQTDEMADKCGH